MTIKGNTVCRRVNTRILDDFKHRRTQLEKEHRLRKKGLEERRLGKARTLMGRYNTPRILRDEEGALLYGAPLW